MLKEKQLAKKKETRTSEKVEKTMNLNIIFVTLTGIACQNSSN